MYGGLFGYGVTWKWDGLVGSVISWVGSGWVDENRPKDNSELWRLDPTSGRR